MKDWIVILFLLVCSCGRVGHVIIEDTPVLTPVNIDLVDPSWAPDGEKIAFVHEYRSDKVISYIRTFDTTIVNITTGTYPNWNSEDSVTYVCFTEEAMYILEICLSNDDSNVIFTISPDDIGLPPGTPPLDLYKGVKRYQNSIIIEDYLSRIWLISIVDSSFTFLIDGNNPEFAPDGSKIVYENSGIYIYSLEDEEYERITPTGKCPVFSPDGEKVAYTDDMWIYVITPHQSGVTRYPLSFTATSLSWSPDGDWIAYRRDDTGVIEALSPYLPHEPWK